MTGKYEKGDKVILSSDKDLIRSNMLSTTFAGKTVVLDSEGYVAEEGEFIGEVYYLIDNEEWSVLERQIIRLAKVDNWRKIIQEEK
jgi:hypothetical protein